MSVEVSDEANKRGGAELLRVRERFSATNVELAYFPESIATRTALGTRTVPPSTECRMRRSRSHANSEWRSSTS
jgi:hypothetical protein